MLVMNLHIAMKEKVCFVNLWHEGSLWKYFNFKISFV